MSIELNTIYRNYYYNSSNGEEKIDLCKRGYTLADKEGNDEYSLLFRLEYVEQQVFYGDMMYAYLIWPEVLKIYDKFVEMKPYTSYTRTVLWEYKWIVENAKSFNQISLKQYEAFVRDFKRRYIKADKSLRTLNLYLANFYSVIDREKAEEFYQKYKRLKRDDRSDCIACERKSEGEYLINTDRFEEGREMYRDIFSGRLTCTEEPYDAYGVLLKKLNSVMVHGDLSVKEEALARRNAIKPAFRRGLLHHLSGDIIGCYAILGDFKNAMLYYKKYCIEMMRNHVPGEKFRFNMGAAMLFKLADNPKRRVKLSPEHPLYNEAGVYNDKDFYDYYLNELVTTANKLDARNGTNYYMDYIKEMLHI